MKKLIISLVLLGVVFATPVYAVTQDEVKQQLIVLITQLIAQLQQQLADLINQPPALVENPITLPSVSPIEPVIPNINEPVGIPTGNVAENVIPFSVECSGVENNNMTTWTAYPAGGSDYSYSWDGDGTNLCGSVFYADGTFKIPANRCFIKDNPIQVPLSHYMRVFVKSGNEVKTAKCSLLQ